jgi:hypothetical protein
MMHMKESWERTRAMVNVRYAAFKNSVQTYLRDVSRMLEMEELFK